MLRIISWNVNGIRAVSGKGMLEWLRKSSPDILMVQETKAHPAMLPKELLEPLDKLGKPYRTYWASAKRKGYAGVAVFSRIEPHSVSFLGDYRFDDEGRGLILDFGVFIAISAYFPNSQEAGARLAYKLEYCAAVRKICDTWRKQGKHIVLGGDYNIAHKAIDLANPEANEGNPGYLPEERAWMDEFTAAGYVDTFRKFDKSPGKYSWWSYRTRARERNVGWRIDYHCVDDEFADAVVAAGIMDEVTGSDHCPVNIDLEVRL